MLFTANDKRRFAVNHSTRAALAVQLIASVRGDLEDTYINRSRLELAETLLNAPRRHTITYEKLVEIVTPVDLKNRVQWGHWREPVKRKK